MDAREYYKKGKEAYNNHQYAEAGELLRKASTLGIRDALLFMAMKADELNNLGVLEDKKGNKMLANKYYQQAIELMPEDDDALLNLAQNYTDEGRLQEAVSLCLRAIKISPQLYRGYLIIGDVFYQVGDFDRAAEWYIKAYHYGYQDIERWLMENGYLSR